jgi:hypothetical protein
VCSLKNRSGPAFDRPLDMQVVFIGADGKESYFVMAAGDV